MAASGLCHSLVECPLKQEVVRHLIPWLLAGGHMVSGHKDILFKAERPSQGCPHTCPMCHSLLCGMGLNSLLGRIVVKIYTDQMCESTQPMAWHRLGGGCASQRCDPGRLFHLSGPPLSHGSHGVQCSSTNLPRAQWL